MADPQELARITTPEQLEEILKRSFTSPVWLFKHSLICPTSSTAWREFEKFASRQADRESIGVIEIQRARDISREVETRTGVRHESPQALLLRDGRPVWNASHWSITEDALDEAASQQLAGGTTSG